MKTQISPCNGTCKYIEYRGIQTCLGCGRTYDDLENWGMASKDQKRDMMKRAKVTLEELRDIYEHFKKPAKI